MKIILTIGDCNGIGPEVMIKTLYYCINLKTLMNHKYTIAGNSEVLAEYIAKLEKPFDFKVAVKDNELCFDTHNIPIIDSCDKCEVKFGIDEACSGRLAAKSIETAVHSILLGENSAMVTMPISKYAMHKAGWNFPGHTELIASRCNIKNPLMILANNKLRVALATIHVPFQTVTDLLNADLLIERINALHKWLLIDMKIKEPKIAVLGLNPHAGESGDIGSEEQEYIIPAIWECNKYHINARGPFPADGFFAHNEYEKYDGVLAMYHDQGLIPLKLLSKGTGVNITGGLPIVRTSPDHGTAYELAGKNIANPMSTVNAVKYAIKLSSNRLSE